MALVIREIRFDDEKTPLGVLLSTAKAIQVDGDRRVVIAVFDEPEAPRGVTHSEPPARVGDGITRYGAGNCPHCSLPLAIHDSADFCPPGTEEFGGRR